MSTESFKVTIGLFATPSEYHSSGFYIFSQPITAIEPEKWVCPDSWVELGERVEFIMEYENKDLISKLVDITNEETAKKTAEIMEEVCGVKAEGDRILDKLRCLPAPPTCQDTEL